MPPGSRGERESDLEFSGFSGVEEDDEEEEEEEEHIKNVTIENSFVRSNITQPNGQ